MPEDRRPEGGPGGGPSDPLAERTWKQALNDTIRNASARRRLAARKSFDPSGVDPSERESPCDQAPAHTSGSPEGPTAAPSGLDRRLIDDLLQCRRPPVPTKHADPFCRNRLAALDKKLERLGAAGRRMRKVLDDMGDQYIRLVSCAIMAEAYRRAVWRWIHDDRVLPPDITSHQQLRSWCLLLHEAVEYARKYPQTIELTRPQPDPASPTETPVEESELPRLLGRFLQGQQLGQKAGRRWGKTLSRLRVRQIDKPRRAISHRMLGKMVRAVWRAMRGLPGYHRPDAPAGIRTIDGAQRALDRAVAWCEEQMGTGDPFPNRLDPGRGLPPEADAGTSPRSDLHDGAALTDVADGPLKEALTRQARQGQHRSAPADGPVSAAVNSSASPPATLTPTDPLCPEQLSILEVLQDAGRAIKQREIAEGAAKKAREQSLNRRERTVLPPSLRTVEVYLPSLLDAGLIARPPGTRRKGVAITPKGRQALAAARL